MLRCLVFFLVEQYLTPLNELSTVDNTYRHSILLAIRLTFLTSAVVCAICEFRRMSLKALDYIKYELKHKLL